MHDSRKYVECVDILCTTDDRQTVRGLSSILRAFL